MKKLLGISIIAVLAVAPVMASADAGAYDNRKVTEATGNSNGIASVSYVQGAYNAAVDVVSEEAAARSQEDTTLSNRIGTLATDGTYIKKSDTKNVSENLGLLDAAVKELSDNAQRNLTAGNGVDITNNTVSVKAVSENSGLSVTSSGVQVTAGTANIVNGAVTTEKIADDAVTTAKIADGNVTAGKLASDSVTTAKILDANVTAQKLATDSVTTAKIADANVTTAKIADGNVTAGKLASDSVTTAKILDANVTKAKLASDVQTSLGKADSAVQSVVQGSTNGTIAVDGTDVAVKGLGSAAYTDSSAYDAAGSAADALDAAKDYTDQKMVQVYTAWNTNTKTEIGALVDTPAAPAAPAGGQS